MCATTHRTNQQPDEWGERGATNGWRTLCFLRERKAHLVSRRRNSLNERFPELRDIGELIKAETALIDGEVVALDQDGLPRFDALRSRQRSCSVVLYAFRLAAPGWIRSHRLPFDHTQGTTPPLSCPAAIVARSVYPTGYRTPSRCCTVLATTYLNNIIAKLSRISLKWGTADTWACSYKLTHRNQASRSSTLDLRIWEAHPLQRSDQLWLGNLYGFFAC